MRILIIEDDQRLTRLMKQVMEEEKLIVDIAHEGNTGLELALRGTYDVAVIDWMLPGRDGLAICRSIRAARMPTALLLLTARSQVEDRVAGLDSGADDYLTKPFSFEELLARIRALGRRFDIGGGDCSELRCGEIVLDLRAHWPARHDSPRFECDRVESAGIPATSSPSGAHTAANPRLRLVLRTKCAAIHGRSLCLVPAAEAQSTGQARPDPNRTRRGLPSGTR